MPDPSSAPAHTVAFRWSALVLVGGLWRPVSGIVTGPDGYEKADAYFEATDQLTMQGLRGAVAQFRATRIRL
ncbi:MULTISPECIES: hypothetical protein [unclassified Streptomyces]|uniref:hypothetical protein n=1 Tax=unclassified Streptomyces TaxID=2593676 RepID=UPI002255C41E|nr:MULTISPECIES: hypothetical protein [unclassified Streptomyces]MCX4989490.1 hypothetical protein [Streptomyces sp. NBC_00568]MCX5005270.1 hypothetical protein [Streptomyces sp. NBC_00638]